MRSLNELSKNATRISGKCVMCSHLVSAMSVAALCQATEAHIDFAHTAGMRLISKHEEQS